MPELSVVIPTYRRPAELRRCLAALARQTACPERFEVIVVEDSGDDEPAAVASAVEALGRPAHRLRAARGDASAARNSGWRSAAAPVVLLLGDDILASPGLVAAHLEVHDRRPEEHVAVLGDVRWADELRRTPLMHWLERGIQSDYHRLDAGGAPSWGEFVTANVSVKRALLERAGGFDEERFPFLYEDTELGLRLHRLGMELVYCPAARAEHLHAPTLAEWRRRVAETARAERRFIECHPDQEYFERRYRAALDDPAAHGRPARVLLPLRGLPVQRLAAFVDHHLDLHLRQLLAPDFLGAWAEGQPPAPSRSAAAKRSQR